MICSVPLQNKSYYSDLLSSDPGAAGPLPPTRKVIIRICALIRDEDVTGSYKQKHTYSASLPALYLTLWRPSGAVSQAAHGISGRGNTHTHPHAHKQYGNNAHDLLSLSHSRLLCAVRSTPPRLPRCMGYVRTFRRKRPAPSLWVARPRTYPTASCAR